MKIIFIDIDGVLNSEAWYEKVESIEPPEDIDCLEPVNNLDPEAVKRLNYIIEKTGALVVISSSWKRVHPLGAIESAFKKHGFHFHLFSVTPSLSTRAEEIEAWLKMTENAVTNFVVIDDMKVWEKHSKFVKTTWKYGLQDDHVQLIIDMLGE